jgi:hypothetical protein
VQPDNHVSRSCLGIDFNAFQVSVGHGVLLRFLATLDLEIRFKLPSIVSIRMDGRPERLTAN